MSTSKAYTIIAVTLVLSLTAGISAELTAEEVSEGECPKLYKAYPKINYTWFIQPRVLYVPMASEHYYRNYAETFLGRPAGSETELNGMKLRIDAVYSRVVNLGYDQHFIQLCLPMVGLGKVNCTFVSGSESINPNALETSVDTIVWTDNESTVIMARCINGFRRNWKVATTSSALKPEVIEKAIGVIEGLGFNTSRVSFRM